MLHCTAPVLFESSANHAVLQDPVNHDWVMLLKALDGKRFDLLARRYYLALQHLRQQRARPPLPGRLEIVAAGKQQALEGMLAAWEERKANRQQAGGRGGCPRYRVTAVGR